MKPPLKWIWHVVIVAAAVGIAFLLSYTDPKGIRTLWTLWTENQKETLQTEQMKVKHQEMTQKVESFKRNDTAQERIVRIQTGYLKDNEMLIEWL